MMNKWLVSAIIAFAIALVVVTAILWYPPLRQNSYEPLSSAALFVQQPETDVLNINLAPAEKLALLPGIGEKRAQAIIDHRNAFGDFQTAEDLLNVPGIGERTIEKLKPMICFN